MSRRRAADRGRRTGRAQARLPVAGAQPRIQYAVRQGERCRADQHRAGAQGRGRAVPRAGAEPGMSAAGDDRPPRADAGAVVAVGRRQDDAVAHAAGSGERTSAVDLGDDARAPAGRGRARHYHFIDRCRIRRDGDAASCSNRPRCSAIATARRASRWRRRSGGPRRAVRHRLAGHAATCAGDAPATSSASSCCRRRRRVGDAGCTRAREDRRRSSARRMRNAIDEMSHWTEYDYVLINGDLDRTLRARCATILADGGGASERRHRRVGSNDFVAKLLADLRRSPI